MIPVQIQEYLWEQEIPYEAHHHRRTVPAQALAAVEHVHGARVAKVVVVRLDDGLALAVVPAPARLDVKRLAEVAGAKVALLASEDSFAGEFFPCEAGAEPPLGLFGLPLWVDAALARQPTILMRAGTHEDAIEVPTRTWVEREGARLVDGLGKVPPTRLA